MTQNDPGIPLVVQLLDYIEQMEKLKKRAAFSVPEDYFVAHQQELTTLPDIEFNLQSDGDDVWLRMPRLQEIAAPDPAAPLDAWVTLSKSPDKSPELKS